ncbi:hypothetical protein T03_1914 [Trichinella britovi]|uniref:Uncharacterized protein n=1 Tax=Trichinella britovi TaxID=45882 RepID=A0A0V1AKD7_TRIBR|nr:hypothetical protein T03_1914 [Trichinella britovi]
MSGHRRLAGLRFTFSFTTLNRGVGRVFLLSGRWISRKVQCEWMLDGRSGRIPH